MNSGLRGRGGLRTTPNKQGKLQNERRKVALQVRGLARSRFLAPLAVPPALSVATRLRLGFDILHRGEGGRWPGIGILAALLLLRYVHLATE